MTAVSPTLPKFNSIPPSPVAHTLNSYQTFDEIRAQAKRTTTDILHSRPAALTCLGQVRKLIEEAPLLETKGDLPGALKKYFQALKWVQCVCIDATTLAQQFTANAILASYKGP